MEEDRRISGLMILFSLLHGGGQGLELWMAYFGVLLRNGLGMGGGPGFFRAFGHTKRRDLFLVGFWMC